MCCLASAGDSLVAAYLDCPAAAGGLRCRGPLPSSCRHPLPLLPAIRPSLSRPVPQRRALALALYLRNPHPNLTSLVWRGSGMSSYASAPARQSQRCVCAFPLSPSHHMALAASSASRERERETDAPCQDERDRTSTPTSRPLTV